LKQVLRAATLGDFIEGIGYSQHGAKIEISP
jgi:hypothetical protein